MANLSSLRLKIVFASVRPERGEVWPSELILNRSGSKVSNIRCFDARVVDDVLHFHSTPSHYPQAPGFYTSLTYCFITVLYINKTDVTSRSYFVRGWRSRSASLWNNDGTFLQPSLSPGIPGGRDSMRAL